MRRICEGCGIRTESKFHNRYFLCAAELDRVERLGELGKARADLYLRIGMAIVGLLALAFLMCRLVVGSAGTSDPFWRYFAGVAAILMSGAFIHALKECFAGLREVCQRLARQDTN